MTPDVGFGLSMASLFFVGIGFATTINGPRWLSITFFALGALHFAPLLIALWMRVIFGGAA